MCFSFCTIYKSLKLILIKYQQNQLVRELNEAMNNSRSNSWRMNTLHVPMSANFAILDDNLIDDNFRYHEPIASLIY